jgi:hypothetical protein
VSRVEAIDKVTARAKYDYEYQGLRLGSARDRATSRRIRDLPITPAKLLE